MNNPIFSMKFKKFYLKNDTANCSIIFQLKSLKHWSLPPVAINQANDEFHQEKCCLQTRYIVQLYSVYVSNRLIKRSFSNVKNIAK